MLESKSQALLSLQPQAILYPIEMSLGKRIKAARKGAKLTQGAVAKAFGITPQAVSQWERDEDVPTPDKFPKLAELMRKSVAYLHGEDHAAKDNVSNPDMRAELSGSLHKQVDSHAQVSTTFGDRDLPVFGTAQGGSQGSLIMTNDAVDWVVRPAPLLRVRDGYGMIISGDSMSPKIENGATALVNPHLPPRSGDLCVFRKREDDGAVHALIKTLRRFTDDTWYLSQLCPKKDFTLKRSEWQVCHVVVGSYFGR